MLYLKSFKTNINFFLKKTFILIFLVYNTLYFFSSKLFLNDYLNPYTLTFKNPKTLQMFNIIILYHYIMSLLLVVIIVTFTFIFFSLSRAYLLFWVKPYYEKKFPGIDDAWEESTYWNLIPNSWDWLVHYLVLHKNFWIPMRQLDIKHELPHDVKQTHAPLLEFLWVLFPTLILLAIAYPSILVLYYNEMYIKPLYTISVIGNQWYWTYEYNDFNLATMFKKHVTHDNAKLIKSLELTSIALTEYMSRSDISKQLHEKDKLILKKLPLRYTIDCNLLIAKNPKFLRLLTTDKCLVLPAKVPLRLLITSSDVIHSWAVPCYGIKMDAVPGRLNQVILTIPLTGTSWGQCSELCGVNHAYMPIEVKVLHHADFLYYMRLKITHILLPHLTTYYKNRIKVIRYLLKKFLILHNQNPELYSISDMYDTCHFSELMSFRKKSIFQNYTFFQNKFKIFNMFILSIKNSNFSFFTLSSEAKSFLTTTNNSKHIISIYYEK